MFHVSEHEEFFFFKKSPAGLVQLSIFVFLKKQTTICCIV